VTSVSVSVCPRSKGKRLELSAPNLVYIILYGSDVHWLRGQKVTTGFVSEHLSYGQKVKCWAIRLRLRLELVRGVSLHVDMTAHISSLLCFVICVKITRKHGNFCRAFCLNHDCVIGGWRRLLGVRKLYWSNHITSSSSSSSSSLLNRWMNWWMCADPGTGGRCMIPPVSLPPPLLFVPYLPSLPCSCRKVAPLTPARGAFGSVVRSVCRPWHAEPCRHTLFYAFLVIKSLLVLTVCQT